MIKTRNRIKKNGIFEDAIPETRADIVNRFAKPETVEDSLYITEQQISAIQQINLEQSTRISALEGVGGALAAYNFGTSVPTQQQLTDYALTMLGISDPLQIWNATHVTNLYDNNVWQLNNTQNTNPTIFEWVPIGNAQVSQATQNSLGTVKGSTATDGISINSDGSMSVNLPDQSYIAHVKGTYSATVTYQVYDIVYGGQDNPGTYIALTATTGDALPGANVEENSIWRRLTHESYELFSGLNDRSANMLLTGRDNMSTTPTPMLYDSEVYVDAQGRLNDSGGLLASSSEMATDIANAVEDEAIIRQTSDEALQAQIDNVSNIQESGVTVSVSPNDITLDPAANAITHVPKSILPSTTSLYIPYRTIVFDGTTVTTYIGDFDDNTIDVKTMSSAYTGMPEVQEYLGEVPTYAQLPATVS